jgi:hypothetical protein
MIENPMNSDLDCGSSSGGMAEALAQLGNTRLKQSEKQILMPEKMSSLCTHSGTRTICVEKP